MGNQYIIFGGGGFTGIGSDAVKICVTTAMVVNIHLVQQEVQNFD